MEILKAKDLDRDSWRSLLGKLAVPDGTRMIIETPEKVIFEWYNPERVPFENCTRGRIFHPRGELRWRYIDGMYRTVFLGEDDWPGETLEDATAELRGLKRRKGSMTLWGERTNLEDEWLEQSIPHRFSYPFKGGTISRGRLQLITENWYDSLGQLVFVCFTGLEEMEGDYA